MKKVHVDDLDSFVSAADTFRPLSGALGTEHVAINHYELGPGDSFGFCYHRHHDQEEVFYVLAGTVTFETESGPVAVSEGEAIRFAPGEFQRGTNRDGERVVALAIGAPRTSEEIDLRRECPDCGERTPHSVDFEDGVVVTTCLDCGAETGRYVA